MVTMARNDCEQILQAIKERSLSWYLVQCRLVLDPITCKVYTAEKKPHEE